jgi:hypothetical protein
MCCTRACKCTAFSLRHLASPVLRLPRPNSPHRNERQEREIEMAIRTARRGVRKVLALALIRGFVTLSFLPAAARAPGIQASAVATQSCVLFYCLLLFSTVCLLALLPSKPLVSLLLFPTFHLLPTSPQSTPHPLPSLPPFPFPLFPLPPNPSSLHSLHSFSPYLN